MKPQKPPTPLTLHEAMRPLQDLGWRLVFFLLRRIVTPLVSFLAGVGVWLLSRGEAERW